MEEEKKLKGGIMETYTEDMAKAIEGSKGGLIKKIIQEEEEHEAEKKEKSPKSKKNQFFIFLGVLLLLASFGILLFFSFWNKEDKTVSVTPQSTSLIFTDQTSFKPVDGLTKDKIAEVFSTSVENTKVKVGGIEGIYFTENNKVLDFKRFNSLIEGNINSKDLGLFSNNFLFGIFKDGLSSISPNKGEPFLLLKVRSFTDVFPTMGSWEKKMFSDLGGFFGVKLSQQTNYLLTKDFESGIVANKNARILRDLNGDIVLMYVYVDDNSVVISNSENAVAEVILRLNASQIKK